MSITINKDRLIKGFTELVSIDSESFSEREMADKLISELREIGFEVCEDDAGSRCGGNAGNIYGFLKGNLPGEPILLSAHMDTVSPGKGKKAVIHDDGIITSDGTTVLGADDAAGLAEILEGIRSVKEAGIPHRDTEILFPIAEEPYIKGTSAFDFSRIRSKEAYTFDISGEVGSAAVKAPTLISFRITVGGKAAHAGFAPEKGINAVETACKAISRIAQGRIDEDTSLNIGTISGGEKTNIVSDKCICSGEVRSFDHNKALGQLRILENAFSAAASETGASFTVVSSVDLTAYEIYRDEPVVSRFLGACSKIGTDGKLTSTFGGSDNHNFVLHGIKGIVLSCGMNNVHSTDEYISTADLVKGAALVSVLITLP